MIGTTIGHYKITAKLGAGGMGEVYRARDTKLERDVALKFLPASMEADAAARERLLREARTASQLNHPNICTIHEVGEAPGQHFIVMELVDGKPLGALIGPEGLPAQQVIRYGAQIADALVHAHERGVVHRDLKSSNVVITPEGRAKVLDFGLAVQRQSDFETVTQSRVSLEEHKAIAGTLPYMAPEVLRAESSDSRSDLWALGVVLYEMAAGRLPFRGQTGFELTSAILRDSVPAPPASVPPALFSVVHRCLEKDRAQRYQRASEIRAALEVISPQRTQDATVPVAAKSFGIPRRRGTVWAVALVAIALVGLVALNISRLRTRLFPSSSPREIRSLAVLPFKSVTSHVGDDLIGTGVADTVIMTVSQIGSFTVRPISAVRKYATQDVDSLEAGRQLQVDAVLDGTVQRSGDLLRLNMNLLRVRDGTSVWSGSVDRAPPTSSKCRTRSLRKSPGHCG